MSSTAYLETRILSADPIELVQILYEYAILSVQEARHRLVAGDIAARSKAVSKCVAILGELEACLDHKTGGTLSQELARLYNYLQGQLTLGNFQQTDAPFGVVESVLQTLAEGWKAVRTLPPQQPAPQPEYSGANNNPWGSGPVPETEYGIGRHTWCA